MWLVPIPLPARATEQQILDTVLKDEQKVFCRKHPGNALLLWNDGTVDCYKCGQEKSKKGFRKSKPMFIRPMPTVWHT